AMDEFAGWLSHQDVKLLPLEALLVVLATALAAHIIAKLFDRWQVASVRLSRAPGHEPTPNLAGTAEDSVNAALGFTAILLPLSTVLLLGMLSLATPALEERLGRTALILVIAGPLVLYFLVAIGYYLVMSFAAVHKVSWGRAAAALATAYVCIAIVAMNIP
ncbi:hypothetical protein, partial [Hypericibacter sp.]|uniref:hypothetical protein n=1 Tax=Hypericibacter sp. TaxID=2705401 RepID=UPI003D6D77BF